MTDIPKKILIQEVFKRLKRDYFPNKKLYLVTTQKKRNFNHVANISARLGMTGKTNILLSSIDLKLSDKFNTKILEEKKWVITSDHGYKGASLNPWRVSQTENTPLQLTGIFYGPCYMETIYDYLSYLFKKSIKMRPNVSETGSEAVLFMQQKRIKYLI